jgi:hypothetical protein
MPYNPRQKVGYDYLRCILLFYLNIRKAILKILS